MLVRHVIKPATIIYLINYTWTFAALTCHSACCEKDQLSYFSLDVFGQYLLHADISASVGAETIGHLLG